ncbi:hypothetical protein D9M71_15400 [compost metagenome]
MSVPYTKKGQSFEEFVKHWVEIHSEIAIKILGLRSYVTNPIDREKYPDSPIDGFSELWFDSIEDVEKAFSSQLGIKACNYIPNFAEKIAVTYIAEIKKH